MEVDWNTASNTRAWVDGYNSATGYRLYDFGDDAGGTTPDNGWKTDDVFYIAYGALNNYPLPEIYNNNCAIKDWGPLDIWAKANKGYYMNFAGSFTEYYASKGADNSPSTGWLELYNAIGSYQGNILNYSTDITWSN